MKKTYSIINHSIDLIIINIKLIIKNQIFFNHSMLVLDLFVFSSL